MTTGVKGVGPIPAVFIPSGPKPWRLSPEVAAWELEIAAETGSEAQSPAVQVGVLLVHFKAAYETEMRVRNENQDLFRKQNNAKQLKRVLWSGLRGQPFGPLRFCEHKTSAQA